MQDESARARVAITVSIGVIGLNGTIPCDATSCIESRICSLVSSLVSSSSLALSLAAERSIPTSDRTPTLHLDRILLDAS